MKKTIKMLMDALEKSHIGMADLSPCNQVKLGDNIYGICEDPLRYNLNVVLDTMKISMQVSSSFADKFSKAFCDENTWPGKAPKGA